MTSTSFGLEFIEGLVERSLERIGFREQTGADDGPHLSLVNVEDRAAPAGYLRLWRAEDGSLADRMIHFRLQSDPVDTQLFFIFGRPESVMPHFHAQVVQFAPEACVFNAEWLPRLDAVEHPDYFTEAFGPITKSYWKAINDRDNLCSLAPANPAIAAFLTPWSIGVGRPTSKAELERVEPQIKAFHEHCLKLAQGMKYDSPPSAEMLSRDRKHLDRFFADELDPRAWKGVYKVIGESIGEQVKTIFKTPLRV